MLTKPLIGLVVILGIALTWFYTSNLKLKNDLQTAIIKVEAGETTIRTMKTGQELLDTQLEQFTAKMLVIEADRVEALIQVDDMRNLFQRHDFANLLSKKPGLVEKLMINKTREVFDEIEALTAP